jgi:hypothetical protein
MIKSMAPAAPPCKVLINLSGTVLKNREGRAPAPGRTCKKMAIRPVATKDIKNPRRKNWQINYGKSLLEIYSG